MRYVSAVHGSKNIAGALVGDEVVPLKGIDELGLHTPNSVLAAAELDEGNAVSLADVRLRPVIPNPQKVIAIGLNYKAHIEETLREDSDYPVMFTKFANALIGPNDQLRLPPESKQLDYEGEMALIIGERGRRISKANAPDHVAGVAVANDVTMRDFQYRTHQWLQGKSWEASTPLGPALVTPDEVDYSKLDIRTELNGEIVQSSNTSLMIFDVPTIINVVSEFTTLEPGDVILTGTPSGIGFRRDPQLFLEPGGTVAVEIEGIGRIENELVAE